MDVGDRVRVVGDLADEFPGVLQVDEVGQTSGLVVLVPDGCVGLAAAGVGQEGWVFAPDELEVV